jgi:hypothetical protein
VVLHEPLQLARINNDAWRCAVPLLLVRIYGDARFCFCPEGVGVRLADDGARSGPETNHLGASDKPCIPVLLPLRARLRASCAPTACGQNQKRFVVLCVPLLPARINNDAWRCAVSLLLARIYGAARCCFCPEGVGVRLADDGARSGPETKRPGVSNKPRIPVLLPLRARSRASCAPTACGQNQKRYLALHEPLLLARINGDAWRCTVLLLPGGRRSPACRRWGAKRP